MTGARNNLLTRVALGAACWAAGCLGWLPALRRTPPVRDREPLQVVAPAAEHLVYGLAAVAAYDWLRDRAGA
jgi:hypothetical protein